MTANIIPIQNPYRLFLDVDGQPLEDGYIYVGVAGLNPEVSANQLAIYFDSALTIPASQPLRTIGGIITNSGSAANIYTFPLRCSITIRNKNGTLIYSVLNTIISDAFGSFYSIGSVAEIGTTEIDSTINLIKVDSYHAVVYPSSVGPKGGHYRFRDGTTGTPGAIVGLTTYDSTGAGFTLVPAPMYDVEVFGALGNGALTGAAQSGTGTGTDDSGAIQLAFDWVRDSGGKLNFTGSSVYRCDTGLTLLRTSNTAPTQYIIDFNGAALDFSNLSNAEYLTVGATSLANIATDFGMVSLTNGRIFGQQTGNPGAGDASTNTNTTGIKTQFCYNLVLNQMAVFRCYKGLETLFTFPILDNQGSYKRNILGIVLNDVSNRATWNGTEVPQCRFGLVTMLDGVYDSGKCVNHTFIGFRTEGSMVGIVLDPGSNNAGIGVLRGFHFIDPYLSGHTYDYIRLGTALDPSDASIRGANSADRVYNFIFDGFGAFFGITPTATKAAIAFSSNNNVRQAEIKLPVDVSVANTIVNTARALDLSCRAQPDATSDTIILRRRYDLSGVLYETNVSENVAGTVTLSPAGISILSSAGGAVTGTLANGTMVGQQKRIGFSGSTSSTVSVTTHASGSPTVFTWNATTDYLILEWSGSQWVTIHNTGVT